MKTTIISAAIRAGVLCGVAVLAMPALAQEGTVPQADQIIEALSAPAVAAPGLRRKGGDRGLSVQIEPAPPPSMDFAVEFQLGSATLTPDAMSVLDQLGAALTSETLSPFAFNIAGHTDAAGPETFNLHLSEQRARAVEDYLAARFGIDRRRLNTIGMGESALLDSGNPFSQQNRRVEITNIGTTGG
jgi:outer membrane protein OmpA-like peptidoglycan-associated protein